MRKKREFIEGAFYHVTSRTNDKNRIFENKLGRKIMLMTLQDAKEKFRFTLANFCVMPTHIHLLIEPGEGVLLSQIMQWLKTNSAKRWNKIHGSIDHVWGNRYFARAVRSPQEYEFIMNYIDQNPVKAELVADPADWQASGAYYKARNLQGLVDFSITERKKYVKLLSPIPPIVSRLLPPLQLNKVSQYLGVYSEAIEQLYTTVKKMPSIGDTETMQTPPVYLHYFTGTADYYISEFDGDDLMFGKYRLNVYPYVDEYRKFSLSNLKSNPFIQLEFSA